MNSKSLTAVASATVLTGSLAVAGADVASADSTQPQQNVTAKTNRSAQAPVEFERVWARAMAGPAGDGLTSTDKARLKKSMLDLGRQVRDARSGSHLPGKVNNWRVGLGTGVYLKHLNPKDQKWFMTVGTATLAAMLPPLGVPAAIAGVIATGSIAAVGLYYESRCMIQLKFSYAGQLQSAKIEKCW